MGEGQNKGDLKRNQVDTYGGKVHVEWNPEAAVTPLGQLPFFINFIKVIGLYDALIEECPLQYGSANAPTKEDVLGTLLLSVLAGQRRYSHITEIGSDGVNPGLLGMTKVEGAVVGYNPIKPGRPCHSYHSYFMANTRLYMTGGLSFFVLPIQLNTMRQLRAALCFSMQ